MMQRDDSSIGVADGWSVFPSLPGSWQWIAYVAGTSESGRAGSYSSAQEQAVRALSRLQTIRKLRARVKL